VFVEEGIYSLQVLSLHTAIRRKKKNHKKNKKDEMRAAMKKL